ncbi:MAG: response regulator [Parafilimonas terrae]|nr:response regulator [Parafilimonas terrae]
MASFTAPTPPVVLLLENEPLQQMMLADIIEEAGCVALMTHSTVEAVRLLETRPDIRVVMADLDVRGSVMGLRLALLIRDRWPPVELMLTGAIRPPPTAMPLRGMFFDKPVDHRVVVPALRLFAGLKA